MNGFRKLALLIAWLSQGLLPAAAARAASLQKVSQSEWGVSGLPSYVNMYIYVPDSLAANSPILVASHHCQGTGPGTYQETSTTLVPLASKNGFIMIFPEATGHNCWDVGSQKSLTHDGGGDTHAIAQMVRYTLSKYKADANRVYAFGGSSGAMMTQALMGVYPDVFMAGVAVSGVPCGCWAEGYTGDTGSYLQWSGPCAGGNVIKTAQQWGELVRSMYPGYSGHRPRLQLWHGTADTTISFKNLAEAVKEWTNVLGLGETPTATDTTTKANYSHQIWKNTCGYVVLETWAAQGVGHGVSWDVPTVAGFLGLDRAGGQDPEMAACPGTGGTGGVSGSGGRAGSGGAGGVGPAGSGGTRGSGGGAGSGGQSGSGGNIGTGGGTGGAAGAAGSLGTGGGLDAGGNDGYGSGGGRTSGESPGGCACTLVGRAGVGDTGLAMLAVATLAALVRRRRSG